MLTILMGKLIWIIFFKIQWGKTKREKRCELRNREKIHRLLVDLKNKTASSYWYQKEKGLLLNQIKKFRRLWEKNSIG